MPYITAGWTLCFEMLFYCAAALCLGARYGLAAVSSVFLVSMLLRGYSDWVVFQFIGNPIICEFILGACIALWVKPGSSRGVAGGILLAAAVLGFSLSYYLGFNGIEAAERIMDGTESMRRAVLWGIPSALLLAAFLQFEDKIRNFRFLVMLSVLGDASYATYLIHRSIIYVLEGNVARLHVVSGYELVIIELCVSFGAGLCVFKLAERPMIRLLRRHLPVEFRINPIARVGQESVATTDP